MLILLCLRGIQFRPFHFDTPCILGCGPPNTCQLNLWKLLTLEFPNTGVILNGSVGVGFLKFALLKKKCRRKKFPIHKRVIVLQQYSEHCTEVHFSSFLSGGFTTMAVINPPERKLAKRTSVHCLGKIWRVRDLQLLNLIVSNNLR